MGSTTIEVPNEFVAPFREYLLDELRAAGDSIEGGAASLAVRGTREPALSELCEVAGRPRGLAAVLTQLRADDEGPITIEAPASALRLVADNAVSRLGERLHTAASEYRVDEIEQRTSELRWFTRLYGRLEGGGGLIT